MELNILIIEDNPSIVNSWIEKFEFYAIEEDAVYNIKATYSSSFADAMKKLSSMHFQAAVVDIRLESHSGEPNSDGNELFKLITESTLAVAAVYTGEPKIVSLAEHQKHFAKVFDKGNGNIDGILEWLDEKSVMIEAIDEVQKSFNIEMAKAFSRSIWPRWNHWVNEQQNETDFTVSALRRHMATHLHATFLIEDECGAHPEEYYFIPPLRENLDTGDIIYSEGNFEIIVTPRCDMVRGKGEPPTYQLVKLTDVSDKWAELEHKLSEAKEDKKKDKVRSAIVKFTNHNGQVGSHFIQRIRVKLPADISEKNYGPFYAQFNHIRSIERNEDTEKELLTNRVASLSNEFVPSLVERLGSYFSRIGTPDYSHPE